MKYCLHPTMAGLSENRNKPKWERCIPISGFWTDAQDDMKCREEKDWTVIILEIEENGNFRYREVCRDACRLNDLYLSLSEIQYGIKPRPRKCKCTIGPIIDIGFDINDVYDELEHKYNFHLKNRVLIRFCKKNAIRFLNSKKNVHAIYNR
jgi:hypothetical protein